MANSPETLTAVQMLLEHLRAIVGQRDRQGLDEAVLLAVQAVLSPSRAQFFRFSRDSSRPGLRAGVLLTRQSAPLPSHREPGANLPLSAYPEYQRCCDKDEVVRLIDNGEHRHIVPIYRFGKPSAILEIERETPLDEQEVFVTNLLLGLFVDHLNLLDYAETDTLTGLLNRKTFDTNLLQVLANAQAESRQIDEETTERRDAEKPSTSTWIAIADIDHFKRINDAHGHIIGDEVLILVARLLRKTFRFDDQLFRFGGEEFVIVLQPTTPEDALAVVERFRSVVEASGFPQIGHLTVSIGMTKIDPVDTPTELLGRADEALYFAKSNGRNQIQCYEQLALDGRIVHRRADKPAPEVF